jgi:hypothetical protein
MISVIAAICLLPVRGIATPLQKTPQIIDINPFFNWCFQCHDGMLVGGERG